MVILHIASIRNNLSNGVCVAVSKHVLEQQKTENVALLNLSKEIIPGIQNLFISDDLESLPYPFCKPDIVIFHEIYRGKYISIARFLSQKQIPYVVIPHGSLTKKAQKQSFLKKNIANFFMFKKFVKNATAIQFLSSTEEKNTSNWNDNKLIGTNGIDMPKSYKNYFNTDKTDIVFIGRLDIHIKGLDLIIKAVKQDKKFIIENNVKIHIYGPDKKGRFEKLKNLIIENGVQDCVFLYGSIVGSEKEKRLLNADLFIQTSRTEAMPMGILEALSYGIPCIVTHKTGLGDLIQEYSAGWSVNTDSTDISNSIRDAVYNRNLWKEKSVNERRLIEDNYLWT